MFLVEKVVVDAWDHLVQNPLFSNPFAIPDAIGNWVLLADCSSCLRIRIWQLGIDIALLNTAAVPEALQIHVVLGAPIPACTLGGKFAPAVHRHNAVLLQ